MRTKWWRVGGVLGVAVMLGGCGWFSPRQVTELPKRLVAWGDPDPNSDATAVAVRDVNDLDDRFVVIGTNGLVQFSVGKVCRDCAVEGATIFIDGEPRMHVRFGGGPHGAAERQPYLVSTNGFYVQLLSDSNVVMFQEEDLPFEPQNDPSDDLAERVGVIDNPAVTG